MDPTTSALSSLELSAAPLLPPELWSHILALSLPAPSYDTWSLRSTLLLSYSLVSRDFRSLAQPLLYRHAVLPQQRNLALLLFTLAGVPRTDDLDEAGERELEERGAYLAGLVRSVRCGERGSNWVDGSREIGELLSLAAKVEEVRLYQVGQIEIAELEKGQALRRLFVVKSTMRHSSKLPRGPLHLPHLQHLHLHLALANVDPLVSTTLLTREALPSLTALARFALGTSATEAALVQSLTSLSLSKPPPATLNCQKLILWDCQSPLPAPPPIPQAQRAVVLYDPSSPPDTPRATTPAPPPPPISDEDIFIPPNVRIVRFSRPSLDLATAPAYLAKLGKVEEVHVRDVVPPTNEGVARLREWCEGGRRKEKVRLVLEPGGETYVEGLFNPHFWALVERVEGWQEAERGGEELGGARKGGAKLER